MKCRVSRKHFRRDRGRASSSVEVVKTTPRERVSDSDVEQIVYVPLPQVMDETMEVMQSVPKEQIQEHIVEESVDDPVPHVMEEIFEVMKLTPR